MDNKGYCGRISNAGAQVVKAPNQQPKGKQDQVLRGTDLRTGNTGGQKK